MKTPFSKNTSVTNISCDIGGDDRSIKRTCEECNLPIHNPWLTKCPRCTKELDWINPCKACSKHRSCAK